MKKPSSISWIKYIKYGASNFFQKKVVRRIHKVLVFSNRSLWEKIEHYKIEARMNKNFTVNYKDYSKYYILYTIIRKLKPRYILECGSGITTIIIALALKENG